MAAARVDAPGTGAQWSAQDAWLISYPDQFGSTGLRGVAEVAQALAPEINGVHVLPFHPSSSDGGFSVQDFSVVDPAVGTWADVSALAAETRLMADAVINHVSSQGRWFRAHLAGEAEYGEYFRVVPDGTDMRAVVRPRPGEPTTAFERGDGSVARYWTTFGADQVDLDYRSPEVLLAVVEAVLRYVRAGATAIRLDAVAFLGKDPATPSIHLPFTHRVVALLRDCLHDVDPRVVLITETNVPHEDNVSYLGSPAQPEAHAVYQFSLAPLVLHAIQTGDTDPVCRWLAAWEPVADTTVLNFLASHDGVGVRPAQGWLTAGEIAALADRCVAAGGQVNMAATGAGAEPYELAATWRSLCEVGTGGPFTPDDLAARILAGHSVALALAGIPLLYAHTLSASANAADCFAATGVSRDLNRARFASPAEYLSRLTDDPVGAVVWAGLRDMLRRRRTGSAFDPASPQRLLDAPPGVVAIQRGADHDAALVVTNLGAVARSVPIGAGWHHGDDETPVAEVLEVGPWARAWLRRPRVSAP